MNQLPALFRAIGLPPRLLLAGVLPVAGLCAAWAAFVPDHFRPLDVPAARAAETPQQPIHLAQGVMAGEVTETTVLLQARLTATAGKQGDDVPGAPGVARFEYAANADFKDSRTTSWKTAAAEGDFIVCWKVAELQPDTVYHYRLHYGAEAGQAQPGPTATFRTHPGVSGSRPVSFVVVTGMNYHYFHHGQGNRPAYAGADREQGFPALVSILKLQPDFFVGTGDNIYYDAPRDTAATAVAEMRRKWHEQFVQPRFVDLFARVPCCWEKDDHDYRYDDCDNRPGRLPTVADGLAVFREQVPVVDPEDPAAVTYRTIRVSKELQVWFVENRDYRSPNLSPDGPEKTIWGAEQSRWLKQTLLESTAVFRLVISPTPMVGPDDARKKDNHTNIGGFRHEGDAFHEWLKREGFLKKNFYWICGDRHWQYHAENPTGFEEFSSGALVDANSRLGRKPGDPQSTDPAGLIKQHYTQSEPSGGFLHVAIVPATSTTPASAVFTFHDENGKVLYTHTKLDQTHR